MNPDYRKGLLNVLACLDQGLAHADAILANPILNEIAVRAEELRELLVEMQAKVEDKLCDPTND